MLFLQAFENQGDRELRMIFEKINFLISQSKGMLWELKRIVSMRQFF